MTVTALTTTITAPPQPSTASQHSPHSPGLPDFDDTIMVYNSETTPVPPDHRHSSSPDPFSNFPVAINRQNAADNQAEAPTSSLTPAHNGQSAALMGSNRWQSWNNIKKHYPRSTIINPELAATGMPREVQKKLAAQDRTLPTHRKINRDMNIGRHRACWTSLFMPPEPTWPLEVTMPDGKLGKKAYREELASW